MLKANQIRPHKIVITKAKMISDNSFSYWGRIEEGLARPVVAATAVKSPKERAVKKGGKIHWKLLDAFGLFFWTFTFVKFFVVDIERWAVTAINPSYVWLLDFRFIGSLAFISLVLIATRRRRRWMVIYLILFPIILVIWKIPRFLYKRRSWTLSIGTIHVLVGSLRKITTFFVIFTLVAISSSLILMRAFPALIISSMIFLALLWIVSLGYSVIRSFYQDPFVSTQNKAITKVLNSKAFWNFVRVDDTYRGGEVTEYTREQANQLLTKASTGVIASRATLVWAEKLDEYRRSPAFVLFGSLTVVRLFVQIVFTAALVNYGLYQVNAGQFAKEFDPTIATFFHYAFSSTLGGGISGFVPRGAWAVAVHIGTGFSVVIVLLILVVSLIFGFRQSRTDESALADIASLRKVSEEFEEKVAEDYGIEPQSLRSRLVELEHIFVSKVLIYLGKQLGQVPERKSGRRSKEQ